MIRYRRSFRGLIRPGVLLGVALLSFSAYAQKESSIPNNERRLFYSEWAFRENAIRKVMPEFPEEALKARAQGLVVLSLYQDGAGNAAYIKVLESPHPAIAAAAVAAAEQWKWRPFVSGGVARPIRGKLTFYFVIEGGVGRVEDPRIITIEEGKKKKTP